MLDPDLDLSKPHQTTWIFTALIKLFINDTTMILP